MSFQRTIAWAVHVATGRRQAGLGTPTEPSEGVRFGGETGLCGHSAGATPNATVAEGQGGGDRRTARRSGREEFGDRAASSGEELRAGADPARHDLRRRSGEPEGACDWRSGEPERSGGNAGRGSDQHAVTEWHGVPRNEAAGTGRERTLSIAPIMR